jgi:ribose 5-phosphate isomerase B
MSSPLAMSKVYIASDHAGFALKASLILYIGTLGYEILDMGATELTPGDDYPDYVTPCAERVAAEPGTFGIIIGKSGQGEAMCANRVKAIQAMVYYAVNPVALRLAREDNNANMLALGAHFLTEDEAKEAVKLFLETHFTNDARHIRRLAKF